MTASNGRTETCGTGKSRIRTNPDADKGKKGKKRSQRPTGGKKGKIKGQVRFQGEKSPGRRKIKKKRVFTLQTLALAIEMRVGRNQMSTAEVSQDGGFHLITKNREAHRAAGNWLSHEGKRGRRIQRTHGAENKKRVTRNAAWKPLSGYE